MQMVTPCSSAIFLTRFRPAMVFLAPSSSDMALRLPEGDDVGDAGLGGQGNVFAKTFLDPGVVFRAVHGAFDFAAAGVTHAADQAIARGYLKFVGIEQIDALQTDLSGVGAKFVERNFLITPAGNGLADISFAFDRGRSLRPRGRGERR